MIKSMTGFGRGEYLEDGKSFTVEMHAVNHRYNDISVRMPRQLSFLEDKVREQVNRFFSRGKIDVYIAYDDKGENSRNVQLNEGLAKAYIDALNSMRENFHITDPLSLSLISSFPDVLKVEKIEEDEEVLWRILATALQHGIDNLVKMRITEGAELHKNILEKACFLEDSLKEISKRAPEVVKEYKRKLETRIKELLDQQVVDETRMATEVAYFADRCSIDEEIVRLSSHINQLRDTLESDHPVGRKLDFLVQEMNREINTIGSKANDITITKIVIDMKSEVEKIREQIQNIE